jgi:hypothetical protein
VVVADLLSGSPSLIKKALRQRLEEGSLDEAVGNIFLSTERLKDTNNKFKALVLSVFGSN